MYTHHVHKVLESIARGIRKTWLLFKETSDFFKRPLDFFPAFPVYWGPLDPSRTSSSIHEPSRYFGVFVVFSIRVCHC